MISITKISGDSMSPEYCDGDYVFSLNSSLIPTSLLSSKRDYIIEHDRIGAMIKRFAGRDPLEKERFLFKGLNEKSISQKEIGSLPRKAIKSLVIYKVSKG